MIYERKPLLTSTDGCRVEYDLPSRSLVLVQSEKVLSKSKCQKQADGWHVLIAGEWKVTQSLSSAADFVLVAWRDTVRAQQGG